MSKLFSIFIISFSLFANDLANKLAQNWLKDDKYLQIKSLKITPDDKLNCEIINYPRLAKQGFFRASCDGKNTQFNFKLSALSKVYKLKKDMLKGELAGFFDLQMQMIDFSKVPYNALRDISGELRFKSKVKVGSVLKTSMLMPNYLINKDDSVVGIIDDGDLSVFVDLIALQSGVKGQKIRLKAPNGKSLTGEIINEKQVRIR